MDVSDVAVNPSTVEYSEIDLIKRSGSASSQLSKSSTKSNENNGGSSFTVSDNLEPSPFQPQRNFSTRSDNKSVNSVNFHTSQEQSDDELQQSQEFESNGSLSDSLNLGSLDKDSLNKDKKHKKKNRISQIISGVSYKSKSELFQKLFKDVAAEEQLVIDYSCALHRDILVHGRLYLSQNWLCFYANIFGWETLVTIQWMEITAITKEKVAKLIPNAIQILTDTDKYFFTTFVTRESAYTVLFRIWQNALLGQPMGPAELKSVCKKFHPKKCNNKDSIDGYPVNDEHEETGDEILEDDIDSKSVVSTSESLENLSKPEVTVVTPSKISSADSTQKKQITIMPDNMEESPINETKQQTSTLEDDHSLHPNIDEHKQPFINTLKHSFNSGTSPFKNNIFYKKKKRKLQRNKYPSYHLSIPDPGGETTTDFDDDSDESPNDENVLCPCHDSHHGKEYASEEFNFDVDALYEHLFAQESDIMKQVFQKRNFYNWRYTPLEKQCDGSYIQMLSYTIPLNYSIGPKQSDTTSKQIFAKDNKTGSFYTVEVENTSGGIPYSDSFYVYTRYCITRAAGNRSRLEAHGELIYTKRVFGLVKNMISRSADEALSDYFNFLISILKSESELIPSKSPRKGKKLLTKIKSKESAKNVAQHDTPGGRKTSSVHNVSQPLDAENNGFLANTRLSSTTLIGFIFVLLLLLSTNFYLLKRLRMLESSVLVGKHEWVTSELPTTRDEWTNLLEYQKGLHDLELLKLKEVIGNTAELLKQVELSVSALHSELEKTSNQNRIKSPVNAYEKKHSQLKDGL